MDKLVISDRFRSWTGEWITAPYFSDIIVTATTQARLDGHPSGRTSNTPILNKA